MKNTAFGILFFICMVMPTAFQATPLPELQGFVTDDAKLLSDFQKDEIETKIRHLSNQKGAQIFVVTIESLAGETIEDFSQRLFDKWRPGRKDIDDGVLFVIARNERKMRIHTGYGLEGAIPDALAKQILADTVLPYLQDEQFAEGIDAGVNRLITVIDSESLPVFEKNNVLADSISSPSKNLALLSVFVLYLSIVFSAIATRNEKAKHWAIACMIISFIVGVIGSIGMKFDSFLFSYFQQPVSGRPYEAYMFLAGLFAFANLVVFLSTLGRAGRNYRFGSNSTGSTSSSSISSASSSSGSSSAGGSSGPSDSSVSGGEGRSGGGGASSDW